MELQRAQTQVVIIAVVKRLQDAGSSIWSAKQVARLVKEDFDVTVSSYLVLQVLKKQFRLSYRPIKRVPFTGNSERNLVLRSLYA